MMVSVPILLLVEDAMVNVTMTINVLVTLLASKDQAILLFQDVFQMEKVTLIIMITVMMLVAQLITIQVVVRLFHLILSTKTMVSVKTGNNVADVVVNVTQMLNVLAT